MACALVAAAAWAPVGPIGSASAGSEARGTSSACDNEGYENLWQLDVDPPSSRLLIRGDQRKWFINDVSPDGRFVVYRDSADESLKLATVAGETLRALAPGGGDIAGSPGSARWAPDGSRIAFGTRPQGAWVVDADGSDLRRLSETAYPLSWSPDSRLIALHERSLGPRHPGKLVLAAADGSRRLAIAPGGSGARWSPGGDWIMYRASENKLHVIRPDGSGHRAFRVPSGASAWTPDGENVLIGRFYVVPPHGAPAFTIVDLSGKVVRSFGLARRLITGVVWSPLGDRIVYSRVLGPEWQDPRDHLFWIRPDATGFRQLTRDRRIGADDTIERIMWVTKGPLRGKRLFYLRAYCA